MPRAVATLLMFDGAAEEAMTFYVSLFKGSQVTRMERYGSGEQGAEGTVKRAEFTVGGHDLICIDSPVRHQFTFTPSISILPMMRNPEAEEFFSSRSARDEVGTAVVEALKGLREYELRGELRVYRSPYAVTANTVFCGAAGMADTFFRLRPSDHTNALATGAEQATIGPEWVRIRLFRPGWPRPDLVHWALKAYDFARAGI